MLLDLEIMLIERFEWSLNDIDATDTVSLLDFFHRLSAPKPEKRVYADEVDL